MMLAGTAWVLGGGISASSEKIVPKAIWKAVNPQGDKTDSDKDGLTDQEEKNWGTNPDKADTDGDKFLDGQEVKNGYDPLKAAPGDKILNNANSNNNSRVPDNNNSNNNLNITGQNSNTNQADTKFLSSSNPSKEITPNKPEGASQGDTTDNITEKVALKVDNIIDQYKLYSSPYNSLNDETRAQVEKDLNDFTASIVKNTGLDFAFSIPEDHLRIGENETKEKGQYLGQIKNILRKNNLLKEDQTIEDGIGTILSDLAGMSKKDIEWQKTNDWKTETDTAYKELSEMPINPELKNLHIRLIRIIRSLDIVFNNMNEGDYFRAFLAAGRADRINAELSKFTEEIK